MRVRGSWPKWLSGVVLVTVAVGVVWLQRGDPVSPVVAAPPASTPAGQPEPPKLLPAAVTGSSQWVVAYIHGSVALTREMLGEYLIFRMGHDRLDNLVNLKIIEHACKHHGISVTAAEVENAFREDLKRLRLTPKEFENRVLKGRGKSLVEYIEDTVRPELLMTRLCHSRVQVSEEDVRKAFEARFGEKVDCQLIFWTKEKEKDAEAVYSKIRNNAEEFDRVAKNQEIPNLSATLGKIAPFGRHSMDNPAVEEAAFQLQPFQVSPLIKGKEGGYLVVKLLGRVPAAKLTDSVEKIKEELRKEAFDRKLQEEMKKAFPDLKNQAAPKNYLTQEQGHRQIAPEVLLVSAQMSPGGTDALRPSPDYSQRIVAQIHGNVPITREMLGEYLIARFGTQRLDNLIYKLVIEYECRKRGIAVTPEEVEAALHQTLVEEKLTLKDFQERIWREGRMSLFEWKEDVIRARLLMTKLFQGRITATEEEIKKAYEAHHGEKVEVQIILWPREEERRVTSAIYPLIRDSAQEFDKAAATQASPSLQQVKGRVSPIGRYSTGNPEMEKVAFGLKHGEVSHVLGVPEGLLVMKCLGRKPAEGIPLETVRAKLEREVIEKKTILEIPRLAEELRQAAKPVKILKDHEDTKQTIRDVEQEIKPLLDRSEPRR